MSVTNADHETLPVSHAGSGPDAHSWRGKRRLAVGAESISGRGVHFRVWAPKAATVHVELGDSAPDLRKALRVHALHSEGNGYFSGTVAEARSGMLYRYQLPNGSFPDPASRYQPDGPHGPSEIVDPSGFHWTDDSWKGVPPGQPIIYEMHVGTFTLAGTWNAAAERLSALAELGVTVLELMPAADFPGRFGWGYDGVNLFAPTRLYGRPEDFRRFVDLAHRLGLAVILDVVYNHFGPDGNYLTEFADHYFTERYSNEWGEAINFDGPESGPVREFFVANAGYWISEFHLDGLRLDATQQIFDASAENVMLAITRQVRKSAGGRRTYVVGENEPQDSTLVRPAAEGGCELDALWNDDFHHSAMVACTGRAEAYYSDYKGTPQEFISAMKWGYLFQGQRYKWQKKRRGTPCLGLEPASFVTYVQNHDQVANSLRGARGHTLTSPGRWRALTALLLLGSGSPMLFQGQEFSASSPFFYFADHNPELAKMVAKGRKQFLAQFKTIACAESNVILTAPEAEETFRRSKLDWAEREMHHAEYQFHRDLIKLRREDPAFSNPRRGGLDGAVLAAEAFVLRYFGEGGRDRLLLVNMGLDVQLDPAPEPLLAPPAGCQWRQKWSSEDPQYGGCGTPPLESEEENWWLPGQSAVVLTAEPLENTDHGENHSKNRSGARHG